MTAYKTMIAVSLSALLLSGCVVSINGEDEIDFNNSHWKERQMENRDAISSLNVGTSLQIVKDRLGNPDDSEGFQKDGKQVVVLYYRTHHEHGDGKTTRDETTPLVFVDDSLVGWGEKVLNDFR